MGFFSKIAETAIDIASLPVDATKDKWTLGGVVTGRKDGYTEERLKKLAKDIDGLIEEVKPEK